jgi:large subunit ribosomal protein L23
MGALPFSKKKREEPQQSAGAGVTALRAAPPPHGLRGKAARPIILRPHVTEKATRLAEHRSYVFVVDRNATKPAVKHAVERRWRVNVIRVRMMRTPRGVRVRGGRVLRKRPALKKAIVTLAEGQKIELAA